MDQKYKRAEIVNVYATQADKDAGTPLWRVSRVPLTFGGFDSYEIEGRILPGYLDRIHTDADACVILKD